MFAGTKRPFTKPNLHIHLAKLFQRVCKLVVIGSLLGSVACSVFSPPVSMPTVLPTPTASPTPYVIMTAMVARLDGELIEVDGCLRVDLYALVWPPDHKMTIEDGQVRVVSGLVSGKRREVILKIGEMVTLSGGIVPSLDDQLKLTIPANCSGPYWAVGNKIQPLTTQTPQ